MSAGSHPSNSRCNHRLLEGGGAARKAWQRWAGASANPTPRPPGSPGPPVHFKSKSKGFGTLVQKLHAVSVFQKFKLNLFWSVSRPIQLCFFPDSVVRFFCACFLCRFCAFFLISVVLFLCFFVVFFVLFYIMILVSFEVCVFFVFFVLFFVVSVCFSCVFLYFFLWSSFVVFGRLPKFIWISIRKA